MASLRWLAPLSLALLCFAQAGCSFNRDEQANACGDDGDCRSDARCYAGFCVPRDPSGTSCAQTSRIESCYDGQPATTRDVGSCKAGQRICVDGTYSECLGQVKPSPEVCNGEDDDCDGTIDDTTSSAQCDTRLLGACGEGAVTCREGIELCQPMRESQPETCNSLDDDCDGTTDELQTAACYPSSAAGCEQGADGLWQCNGLCATGQTTCGGEADGCSGAVTPGVERCTVEPAFPADEDCDGAVDEGCDCPSGDSRDCYAGPIGTRGIGTCRAGSQTCVDAEWGECAMQVLPAAETCDNSGRDDDCNGVEDDVPGLGLPCIALGETGECRNGTLTCMGDLEPRCAKGPSAMEECDAVDQDCDGDPTNGFDLSSDARCGSCTNACSQDETCCAGDCIAVADLEENVDNCGACGRSCGFGQYCCQGDCLSVATPMMMACDCTSDCGTKSCCGTNCRDLQNDKDHCGACGRKCGRDESCNNGSCRK